jgi:hypothetical protein
MAGESEMAHLQPKVWNTGFKKRKMAWGVFL